MSETIPLCRLYNYSGNNGLYVSGGVKSFCNIHGLPFMIILRMVLIGKQYNMMKRRTAQDNQEGQEQRDD